MTELEQALHLIARQSHALSTVTLLLQWMSCDELADVNEFQLRHMGHLLGVGDVTQVDDCCLATAMLDWLAALEEVES